MSNLYMSRNILNDFYIPLGVPGPLVIEAPTVLIDVQIPFALTYRLKNDNYINLEDISRNNNRIYINNIELLNNKKLQISGIFYKKLQKTNKYYPDLCGTEEYIKIYINDIVRLNCTPQLDLNICENNILQNIDTSKISIHPSKACIEKIYLEKSHKVTFLKILLSIRIQILQNQKIFIPEPDGNVILLNKNSPKFKHHFSTLPPEYVIGYNPKNGMIAEQIESE